MRYVISTLSATAFAVLLASCSGGDSGAGTTPANAPQAARPTPAAFVKDDNNDLVEFHYGWSKEAAAEPKLVETLKADMDKLWADIRSSANADRDERKKRGFEFHAYTSSTDYQTSGESGRLLSLRADHSEYTGGAHSNSMTSLLLWDRGTERAIKFGDLFTAPENRDRLLTQRWCDALNVEREKKRGAPVGGDGIFDECPKLDDIAIIPTDKDGNGKFEWLVLVASPYVAGPYVEGNYEVDLAVTPDLIAALGESYHNSFEAGQLPQ